MRILFEELPLLPKPIGPRKMLYVLSRVIRVQQKQKTQSRLCHVGVLNHSILTSCCPDICKKSGLLWYFRFWLIYPTISGSASTSATHKNLQIFVKFGYVIHNINFRMTYSVSVTHARYFIRIWLKIWFTKRTFNIRVESWKTIKVINRS